MEIEILDKLKFFALESYRNKIAYGGRNGFKSWGIADASIYRIIKNPSN